MGDPRGNDGQDAALRAPPGLTKSHPQEPERADAAEVAPPVLGLDSGDPLLRRAQEALGVQLAAAKQRLEAELREKQKALSVRALPLASAIHTVRQRPNCGVRSCA